MIIIGLFLSALGLSTIITVVMSELTRRRPGSGSNAHLRARLDPIMDEDEEDQKILRALIVSVVGGTVLLAGALLMAYGMILG